MMGTQKLVYHLVLMYFLNIKSVKSDCADKIVGGRRAKPGQFPWQIEFRSPGSVIQGRNPYGHFCGGTIISDNVILTAAHCMVGIDLSRVTVVAGEHNLAKQEGPEQRRAIHTVIIHEDYDRDEQINDLALVRVNPPFNLSKRRAKAIRLSNDEEWASSSKRAEASGWGSVTNTRPSNLKVPNILKYTNFTVFRDYHPNREDQICGKGVGGSNVCSGDSGGPLVCKYNAGRKSHFLCGVSQYVYDSPAGDHECRRGYACFASVSYHRGWIIDNTQLIQRNK